MKNLGKFLILICFASCAPDTDFVEQVIVIEEPEIPSAVSLIFPENNSECTTGVLVSETESEVVFDWSDAEISDGYQLTLINLSTGQNQTFDSDSSSMPIRLLLGTPYSWKITSFVNSSTETAESATESFYNSGPGLEFYVPFPASNPSPSSGSSFLSSTTTIDVEWEGNDLDDDIVGYDFYFGINNPPPLEASDIETAVMNDVVISAGNVYYWQVVTKDSVGNESKSAIFYFTVQ